MKFYGGYKYRSLSKRRWDKLRKENFLAKFKRDPLHVPILFLEPDQCPSPGILGGPVCTAIAIAFITQAEEMVEEMKDLQLQWDCLAQEADNAEKEWDRMCNWVHDLRSDVKGELERLEQDLTSTKEELAQLDGQKERFGGLWSESHTHSIIQCSMVVKGCFSWAKNTQKEGEE